MPSERDIYGSEYVLNQEHWNHIGRSSTGAGGIEEPVKLHQPHPLMAEDTVVSDSRTWTVQNGSRLLADEVCETPITVSVECHEDKYEQEVDRSDEDSDTSEIADDFCWKEKLEPSGSTELINVSEEDTIVSEHEPMSLDSEEFPQNVLEETQHEWSTKQLEFLRKVAVHKWVSWQQFTDPMRKQNSIKIAKTLLHNSDCLGCDTCRVPKVLIAHREMCHNISCEVCKMLDFAGMLHSTDCTTMSCRVKDCARNKQEFDALVKDVALEHEYTVEYSATSLFEKGTKLYKNLDFCFLTKRFINEGSYGKVYRVHFFAPGLGVEADLAVKESIPKKDFLGFTERYPAKQQAEIFGRLAPHPNIANPLLILCKRDGSTLIIMERQSNSLYDLQKKYREQGKGLPVGDALYYGNQIVGAVAELHEKCIVHKDIKGKNILLDETQQKALLTDFDGCLLLYAMDRSVCESVKGTRGFIAPEVEMKKSHGTKADIYGIGCLFIDLIIGIDPEGTHDTRIQKVNDIEARAPEVGQMIRRCLEWNPENRPTAIELLDYNIMKDYGKVTPTLQFCANSQTTHELIRPQKDVVCDALLALKLEILEKMDDLRVLEAMQSLEKTLPPRHMPGTLLGTEELMDVS